MQLLRALLRARARALTESRRNRSVGAYARVSG